MRGKREKTFGAGRALPLDRNAKVRIIAYAKGWTALHCQDRQHRGPITRAFLEVLTALLWGFHNSRSGCCFPSYEAIATRADCARSTVAEALKVLEYAGVLTWQHRLTRIREQCRDLFGNHGWRWKIIRRSNTYQFREPEAARQAAIPRKSENPARNLNQDTSTQQTPPAPRTGIGWEAARARIEAAIARKPIG